MSRYINAEGFEKLFDEQYKATRKLINEGETHLDNIAEGFSEAARVIRKIPTADVVEVRHGYWIHESFISKTGEKMYRTPYCSVCQNSQCFKMKYCPECGAKMDGERSEE